MHRYTALTVFMFIVICSGNADASAYIDESREAEAEGLTTIGRWEEVSGFGLSLQIGVDDMMGDFCGDDALNCMADWAFALIMDYRFDPIQGAVPFAFAADLFLENSLMFVRLDPGIMTNTVGIWYHLTVGPKFHFLFFDWLDAYFGAGLGYAHFYAKGETRDENVEGSYGLHGLGFQFMFGADFFLTEKAPGLGFGPVFKFVVPHWLSGCYDGTDLGRRYASWAEDGECMDREEMNAMDEDETSRLPDAFFFGLNVGYHFN